jgi:hypothetical protein
MPHIDPSLKVVGTARCPVAWAQRGGSQNLTKRRPSVAVPEGVSLGLVA